MSTLQVPQALVTHSLPPLECMKWGLGAEKGTKSPVKQPARWSINFKYPWGPAAAFGLWAPSVVRFVQVPAGAQLCAWPTEGFVHVCWK